MKQPFQMNTEPTDNDIAFLALQVKQLEVINAAMTRQIEINEQRIKELNEQIWGIAIK